MLLICLQFTLSKKAKQCMLARRKCYQVVCVYNDTLLYFEQLFLEVVSFKIC